jgi:NAD-dependent DNA ligase
MLDKLNHILISIIHGNLNEIYTVDNMSIIQNEALRLLQNKQWDYVDISIAQLILKICNIVYNNTDAMCPLDDGIYDQLNEIYKLYDPLHYQIGGQVVGINNTGRYAPEGETQEYKCPIIFADESVKNGLFYDNLTADPMFDTRLYNRNIDRNVYEPNKRLNQTVPHKYPKLVGTLDKCKFVLMREAIEAGVADDPAIKVFERDFLGQHLMQGIINNHDPITLILELKYDGMSVEADVCDHIITARSRGDTNADLAEDLTPVLKGYPFFQCASIPENEAFGMKFEAIITKQNLQKLSVLKGKPYKNGRNGIVGLMKSIDAYAYRDLITLVPLETSLDIDPITEIEFMNKYYTSGVNLKYAVVTGTYEQVLYQVYKFVQEAQAIRDIMPFMYDGVDQRIRNILGRENSVNKYSMAIKFNPTVKEAIFLGYTYTVGQNGNITPMIHYTPVEFFGTIHSKSSGHSYQRFKELDLAVGEVITVAYVNDVMPYVSKPLATAEFITPSKIKEEFPSSCPCCGSQLMFSDSGRTARCPNPHCPDRVIARLTNMVNKLNIKGFSEVALRSMNVTSFKDFISIDLDRATKALGQVNGTKFKQILDEFLRTPIYDYQLVGSLGFTNVAAMTWKKILHEIPLANLVSFTDNQLYNALSGIKGIGEVTIKVIVDERPQFYEDLVAFTEMPNTVATYGSIQKTIRFTGFRDQELEAYLTSLGYDANSKASVTKSTFILLIPHAGFMSEKVKKAGENTIIVPVDEFKQNMQYYLSLTAYY